MNPIPSNDSASPQGGSAFSASGPENGPSQCFPTQPPGYSTQQAWTHRDPTGDLSYEFCRVYGPAAGTGPRGSFSHLDEGRSYWAVLWLARDASVQDHAVSRWTTYAQARKLLGAGLTFRRFSSPMHMRDELPRLLGVAEIVVDHAQPGTPGSKRAA
jgi:hypothetical protein